MKTFDVTKFKRTLTDKMNIPVGFSDPKIWINTGNYSLNRLISGDYNGGIPLSKVTMFAGESGSGKSLLAANVMKKAQQDHNAFVLLLDSEGAADEAWLRNAGVNLSEKKFLRVPVFTVTDCTEIVAEFIKSMKAAEANQPVLIVIDSLGMLETDSGQENFLKGQAKGDQGQLAKQLKRFIKNCIYLCEQTNIGFLMTNHTYDSQDMFNPDQKISGGNGIIYASSIVIATRKAKLKDITEDMEISTSTGVHGIKTNVMVYKSRYNKPFEKTTVSIPWAVGIDPYSGLIEMLELDGTLKKDGNKLLYVDKAGNSHKYFRKQISNELLDLIMKENPYLISREDLVEAEKRDQEMVKASKDNGE